MIANGNLLILLLVAGQSFAALPDGWNACKKSSPDYDECFKKQFTNALKTLKNGNKKLGVTPLDPLKQNSLSLAQGQGPVSITMGLKGVDLKGLSNIKVNSFKNDWKRMELNCSLDHFVLEGTYKIKGKVLVLPITGNGKCKVTWTGMSLTFILNMKEVENNGKKYYQLTSLPFNYTAKKMEFHFDNLFNGNKQQGDGMNKFLSENWKEIDGALQPTMTKAIESGFMEYTNRILAKIPADEINVK